jgi:hypothetical protein
MIVFCGKCFAAVWLGSVAIHRKTQLQNFSLYRHGAGCRNLSRAGASHAMTVPDYISPIIGYRVWRWNAAGLKSLNGEPWSPGKPLAAACRASNRGTTVGRAEAAHDANDAPREKCTCGVYASNSQEQASKPLPLTAVLPQHRRKPLPAGL